MPHHEVSGLCVICADTLVYGKEAYPEDAEEPFVVDRKNQKPCIQIGCGHVFHAECLRQHLRARWPDKNISFRFLKCPKCRRDIEGTSHVSQFHQEVSKVSALKRNIITDAIVHMKGDKIPEYKNAPTE